MSLAVPFFPFVGFTDSRVFLAFLLFLSIFFRFVLFQLFCGWCWICKVSCHRKQKHILFLNQYFKISFNSTIISWNCTENEKWNLKTCALHIFSKLENHLSIKSICNCKGPAYFWKKMWLKITHVCTVTMMYLLHGPTGWAYLSIKVQL